MGDEGTHCLWMLPEHLEERIHRLSERPEPEGEFILYWMRTAARGHDNPALDVALTAAAALDLPVFVYHALSERYPYASDRHHAFILEGARDVQAELAARGIGYAFHLERPGHRGAFLRMLAERSALVVTEDMPVRPLQQWTMSLARSTDAPVWLVDTACIAPMRKLGRAYERAFAFRKAAQPLQETRLDRAWTDVKPAHAAFVPELPFSPVDLATADVLELVASCDIDHSIAPVPHTRGGSVAGYERWDEFVANGLTNYARRRNDPLRNGVSRMSAYLHYGHVSPFRIAGEAAQRGGPGADKYLDELLVWRELAYGYCAHRPDHESMSTLPGWARATLEIHSRDTREASFSHEQLARARTGDALWDAAQRSLLIHGELHNNVRMTWGKTLAGWTDSPERALAMAIDLNHRFALDGRDPASYGGILWCFGQFDHPFQPEQPVLGTVRPRPTDWHATRIDVPEYARRTSRPAVTPTRVAVVGAGIAGLACARTLADHGLDVRVFDKSRGTGGRMATRRNDGATFDHGAQYFTTDHPTFRRYVESWLYDGVVAEWNGEVVRLENGVATPESSSDARLVGTPGMSAVTRHLAADLDVMTEARIVRVEMSGDQLVLQSEAGDSFESDAVVIAIPAPQAVDLLAACPALQRRARQVEHAPCITLMVEFATRLDVGFDGAFVDSSPLAWIARDSSKPGRPDGERWVLQAGREWSEARFHAESNDYALLDALAQAVGRRTPDVVHASVHRWRYAIPAESLATSCLFDADSMVGACGDWCHGPRIERAFLSGIAMAGRLLGAVARRTRVPVRQRQLFTG